MREGVPGEEASASSPISAKHLHFPGTTRDPQGLVQEGREQQDTGTPSLKQRGKNHVTVTDAQFPVSRIQRLAGEMCSWSQLPLTSRVWSSTSSSAEQKCRPGPKSSHSPTSEELEQRVSSHAWCPLLSPSDLPLCACVAG